MKHSNHTNHFFYRSLQKCYQKSQSRTSKEVCLPSNRVPGNRMDYQAPGKAFIEKKNYIVVDRFYNVYFVTCKTCVMHSSLMDYQTFAD